MLQSYQEGWTTLANGNGLVLVVQRMNNAIHWINNYPTDSVVCFVNTFHWIVIYMYWTVLSTLWTTGAWCEVKMFYLYLGFIWVTFFSVDTIVTLYILESIVHQAAMTTIVSKWCGTIHKVLFTERNKFASLSEVLSFQRSSLKKVHQNINSPQHLPYISCNKRYENVVIHQCDMH